MSSKIYPKLGYLLISRDRDPKLILDRLKEISDQKYPAFKVIVCVERPEFVEETRDLLEKSAFDNFNVVQLYEFDHRDLEIVDECYRYNEGGYLAVFESDYKIPSDFFTELNANLQYGHRIVYVAPYNDNGLSGMIIHCVIFKYLRGNKPVIHPDGTVDRRTFAERVKEMEQTIEGKL